MKNLLTLILAVMFAAFLAPPTTHAQILKTITPAKDTCVDVDTTVINVTPSSNDVIAFHVKAAKVSGTVAGKFYLQASIDNTNWVTTDSVSLANQSYNLGTFEPSALSYAYYRIRVVTSGTCKINAIRGYNLRRTR
jgi:hypothetical protein